MPAKLRITDVERIVVDVPFTPRCQEWNAREVWQWRISEIIRIATEDPAATLRKLIEARTPEYAKADVEIQSRDVPHDKIVDEIIVALAAYLGVRVGCPSTTEAENNVP
jgi:hypothetical protein